MDGWRQHGVVALGGATGATLRALVVLTATGAFVGGDDVAVVLVLNLAGAGLLGWLLGRAEGDVRWRRRVAAFGTGVLGATTTFSTLAWQLASLVGDGRLAAAAGLAGVSLVAGPLVAVVGLRLGRVPTVVRGADRW